MRPVPARFLAPVLLLGLLVGGCSGGSEGDPAASSSGSRGASSGAASPAPGSPSESPSAAGPTQTNSIGAWSRCTNTDGFSVAYPPGWATAAEAGAVPGCTWFAPAPFTVVPNSDERPAPIVVTIERVPFATVSAPGPGQSARVPTTVAGRRAFRIEARATGEGLLPAGTRIVRYAVDVEDAVPAGGTLVLDLTGSPRTDVRTLTPVLDRMAASVRLTS